MPVELLGTISSIIIAISLMQKNIKWLRLMNFIGAVSFSWYGLIISAWPVFGVNIFIALIDIYFLLQEQKKKDKFDYLELHTVDSQYLIHFLKFHRDDIRAFIPDAQFPPPDDSRAFVILRNALPVSLVIFREESKGKYEILMDYAVPQYRDKQNARFFFDYVAGHLNPDEFVEFHSRGGTRQHQKYLKSMKFHQVGEDSFVRS